jgi:hypothetical protein
MVQLALSCWGSAEHTCHDRKESLGIVALAFIIQVSSHSAANIFLRPGILLLGGLSNEVLLMPANPKLGGGNYGQSLPTHARALSHMEQ